MAKRKRESAPEGDRLEAKNSTKKAKAATKAPQSTVIKLSDNGSVTIQIVAGSYDRVLHGITATVKPAPAAAAPAKKKGKDSDAPAQPQPKTEFADTFLFNAHNSAIRCLALSPPSAPAPGQSQKVLLATGSTDERINIYNLSAHPPSHRAEEDKEWKLLSSLAPRPILENPKNRELGTLLHHSSNITRLAFPNRSKLLSAAEDSTIAVTRCRDWTLLHTFKCPIPKVHGRPSGDTAGVGGVPHGVNDFAVHPSNKIMISVSKGERCMRLWNLETGKKSRVLNFERGLLAELGEGKHSTGEARRIVWGSARGGEDEFAVGFDRDVLVFGIDCVPRCRVMQDARMKVHEFCYVELGGERDETVLAVSTEDGRVVFFSTAEEDLEAPPKDKTLRVARLVGTLGGKEAGVEGRIKDFTVLPVEDRERKRSFFIVTGSSDGRIRLWQVGAEDLSSSSTGESPKQVGQLLGLYETQNRITCVAAFVMIPRPQGAEESEYEFETEESEESGDE
ncbi:WD40 repeat-like protein [Parathielavia appendiculata]|uniref:WD40 repeat-like protein n=1 Tax=Parathielavia appendiculata TaxID=2587402 RepID=A0AAN6U082_9PEZI|nr:WD40 repeat-like protein [Parathielavia appendiculata]